MLSFVVQLFINKAANDITISLKFIFYGLVFEILKLYTTTDTEYLHNDKYIIYIVIITYLLNYLTKFEYIYCLNCTSFLNSSILDTVVVIF